ncbi:MAG: transcriptional repressor [Rhodospirillales bacterium]|nr:transcriptional repressor [Rhodospirillales bacterium]
MAALKRRRTPPFPGRGHDHARCVDVALGEATRLCARDGQRLTPLRRRVLELVWGSHQPVGAYAILDRLKQDGRAAAPPTVYRALDFLLARGLIHRIASLNAFVGCARPDGSHPAQFLICRRCGTAAEIDDPRLAAAIGRSATESGFAVDAPIVELRGLCAGCRRPAAG